MGQTRASPANAPGEAPSTLKQTAITYLDGHQEAKALAAAQIAAGLFPADADAKAILCKALLRTGQSREALAMAATLPEEYRDRYGLRSALEAGQAAAEADNHIKGGLESGDEERFQTGAALLERAVAIDPANLAFREALAWLYVDKLAQPRRARGHLLTILGAVPSALRARELLAVSYSQDGRLTEAIDLFRGILQQSPSNRWMQFNLAKTLSWGRQYAEAETIYRGLLLAVPEDVPAQIGLLEILAWRGQRARALDAAKLLMTKTPSSPAAQSFVGDMYRSDWQLQAAAAQYQAALGVDPGFAPATTGLRTVSQLRSPRLEPRAFTFSDSGNFEQTMLGLSSTFPVSERGFVDFLFEEWRFRAGDAISEPRRDIGAALTYHWNRIFETRTGVTLFKISGGDAVMSPTLSAKWSPSPVAAVYLSGSFRAPVTDSILTATRGLSQNTVGFGLDATMARGLSVQLAASHSTYSDDNSRRAFSPQMSYRLPGGIPATTRVQYDFYAFGQSRSDYFTPARFQVLRSMFEVEPKIARNISVVLKGELPYVITRREMGSGATAGLRFGESLGAHGEIVFFRHRVPGGAEVWSGRGLSATFSIGLGQ